MERAFKGIWIPSEIWLNKDLKLIEKIFLVEIDSLDNKDGCFASNDYFSDFFSLSKNRCSEIIKSLESKGYITANYIYKKDTKYIEKRVLKVTYRYIRKTEYIVDKPTDIFEKPTTPSENCEDNNTTNNITNNSMYIYKDKDKNLSLISKCYQENIGQIYPISREWLIEISGKIEAELFTRAVEICIDRNNVNQGYLKGILKKWLEKNITTLEDLKAYEIQSNNKKHSNNSIPNNKQFIPNFNQQKKYRTGAGANVNETFRQYDTEIINRLAMQEQLKEIEKIKKKGKLK